MSVLSLIKPVIGRPDATEDQKLVNALTAIETWANGQIDHTNLSGTAGIATGQIAVLAITTPLLAKEGVTEEKLAKAVQEKLTSSSLKMEIGAPPSYLSWARVSAAGAIEASSGDFASIERKNTSLYKITWTTAKSSTKYAVIASVNGGGVLNRVATVNEVAAGYFEVVLTNANGGAEEAHPFGVVVLALS